jgi:hypothetical protein
VRLDAGQDKTDPGLRGNKVDLDQGTHASGPTEPDPTEVEHQHSHGQLQSAEGHFGEQVDRRHVKLTGYGKTG